MDEQRAEPLIFLIAGEPSGDALGSGLMAAIRRRLPGARFAGVGGQLMTAEGLTSLFPMTDLAVMGVAEVLPRLPRILRRIRETADAVGTSRPDIVVTIDSPDFTHRVAKRIRPSGIPIVHYVAPTVWAWRTGRAAKLAQLVDHVMTLYPFEPSYFETVGLKATFVGHPVADPNGAPAGEGARFRASAGVPGDAPLLAVLPGSRRGEIARHLPVFGATVNRLAGHVANLHVAVPTLRHLRSEVARATSDWVTPVAITTKREVFPDALDAADVALAASGTVVLELARAGLPAVVGYRLNPLSAWLARRLVKLDHASLVNIVLGREINPECLLEDCTPKRLLEELRALFDDPERRRAQCQAYGDALAALRAEGQRPSARAADVVIGMLSQG